VEGGEEGVTSSEYVLSDDHWAWSFVPEGGVLDWVEVHFVGPDGFPHRTVLRTPDDTEQAPTYKPRAGQRLAQQRDDAQNEAVFLAQRVRDQERLLAAYRIGTRVTPAGAIDRLTAGRRQWEAIRERMTLR
jgi:hypothetical protein